MIQKLIVEHASPTLCGLKTANLISINSKYIIEDMIVFYNQILRKFDLKLYLLKKQ